MWVCEQEPSESEEALRGTRQVETQANVDTSDKNCRATERERKRGRVKERERGIRDSITAYLW